MEEEIISNEIIPIINEPNYSPIFLNIDGEEYKSQNLKPNINDVPPNKYPYDPENIGGEI